MSSKSMLSGSGKGRKTCDPSESVSPSSSSTGMGGRHSEAIVVMNMIRRSRKVSSATAFSRNNCGDVVPASHNYKTRISECLNSDSIIETYQKMYVRSAVALILNSPVMV